MSARFAAPRAALAGLLALLLLAGALGLALPGTARADSAPLDPADPATPTTVTADALPTVQINGVVWSQVVVGTTVYAAGEFTRARPAGAPAGTQETVRNNFLAYDIRTGELITSFAPDLDGPALAVAASPDGSRVYVGGDFTVANGQQRRRIAAYSTATGQLVPEFRPTMYGRVHAIATSGNTVYVGGAFPQVGSASRHRLAAFSAGGELLPWNPIPGPGPILNHDGNTNTSDVVRALVVTGGGSQVVVGGHFDTLNGVKATGVGALDAVTGATRPFAINQRITNQGVNGAINHLSTDGTTVYGTAYDFYGPGNLEGGFAATADGGEVVWINDCHGDTYSSFPLNGAVYIAGHPHVCANIGGFHEHSPRIHRYATAVSAAPTGTVGPATLTNSRVRPDGTIVSTSQRQYPSSGTLLAGQPAPSLLTWFPTMSIGSYTQQYQAGWSVAGNDQYVVFGGEFPRVNGVGQQGLVRYALPSTAPNRVGPAAGPLSPSVDSPLGGMVRVAWSTTNDQDNEHLVYRVYRDGDDRTPIHETTRSSIWWSPQPMGFVDLGVSPGTHTYRVSAFDAHGNRANSPWMSVQVTAGSIAQRAYGDAVRGDGATHYWPLGERSGSTAYDYASAGDLAVRSASGSTPTQGVAGAVTGDPDTAYRFNATSSGANRGILSTQTAVAGPQTFTAEAWFRTTSTAGGKILGFGSSATGNSSNYDRHIYLNTAGRLNFGVYPGAERVITSPAAYNDGQWHHVAASLSPAGMALYVDGVLVGSRTDTTSAQVYNGYWRVGGDTSWSGAAYFAGEIDEVAIYPVALSADRVANHHSLGATGSAINLAPTAAFTSTVSDLAAAFDGSGSTDEDGTVVAHDWDFGDGGTATGATAQHTYAEAGTYTVTLRVTDDAGATAETSREVTVTAPPPNVAPTAAFTVAASGLSVSVDGTTSADTDGSVVAYGWDFGDGGTATGATAQHVYAEAGTYTVTLQVTDDDGDTATAEQSVTVERATVLAADAFGRTVSGGLGTADVGGDWTVQFGAPRHAVTPGAATLSLAAPGNNTGSFLGAVSGQDVDVRTTLALEGSPTGNGTSVYVAARRVSETELYRARLRFLADGTVRAAITRLSGSFSEVVIGGEVVVPGVSSTAGTPLNLRLQIEGEGTTELSATVWAEGSPEPATPTVTRTDSTASLQAPGAVGLSAYLAGNATSPVAVRFSRLTAVPFGAPAPDPETNQAPTAEFTATAEELTVSVDGSASADTDGTVASYAWDFGDGTTATGPTAVHPYAAAGTYVVTLTVTDDRGATGTVTRPVTVTVPGEPGVPAPVALDTFARTVSGGLGTADVGGDWTVQFGAPRHSVAPGAARLELSAPGNNTGSFLGAVSAQDLDVRTTLALEGSPTGNGTSVYVAARRVSETELYRARLRFLADGTVRAAITRLSGSFSEVVIGGEVVVPGVSSTAGTPLDVRLQIEGEGTTELSATVWAEGSPEPATPTVTRTDSTASLQAPGAVGLSAYLAGNATSPVAVRFAGLTALPAGAPAGNQAPVAAFTAAVDQLALAVDGSGSTDADGTVAGYAWDFGDGTTATGATAQHAYAAAGSYTVTLTVTDDAGATGTATRSVTVTATGEPGDPGEPVDPAVVATDSFARTVSGGLGAADVGGDWTVQFGAPRHSVAPGAARLELSAPGNNTGSFLGAVSAQDVDVHATLSLEQAPTGGGTSVYVAARRVSETELYRARLRFLTDGTVRVAITRLAGSFSETVIGGEVVVPGASSAPGTPLHVRFRVTGSGTAQLAATVWAEGSPEPTTPTVTRTDATASLQAAGAVGLSAYLAGNATAPTAVRFTGFTVRDIG
ncbi:PKD domain-containing protein [Blastococcus sp. CCUG 61487]|uniref:PKD domain-containing protein n=1 Tax=Blastococcus sp. CCUG 61487 TaxID=1840703 RepID=UPI001BAFF444|nr:PKD domain-containing protein [Blastococcus sp. CCUG 61487]